MLEIEIENLTLEGLSETEARRAGRAFEDALVALIGLYGLPEGVETADIAQIQLGDLPASANAPEHIGRALADALFAELGG